MAARRVDAPPRGRLFQEDLRRNPFWMMVGCQLANRTTWEQAWPAFLHIRRAHPDVPALARARPEDLHDALRPLGLWRRRAIILPRFARAWLQSPPAVYDDVLGLPGCGKYAADSWAVFVEDRLDVDPDDGKLNWYLDRRKGQTT